MSTVIDGVFGIATPSLSTNSLVANSYTGNISNTLVTATGTLSARSLANRFADFVNVRDFGAKGDGVTDDSAAFQAAINACNTIHLDRRGIYVVKNINLSNSQAIIGNGAIVKAAPGATYIFKLTNFASNITEVYISEANTLSAAIVFGGGRFCSLSDTRILNCSAAGILFEPNVLTPDTLQYVNKPQISNVVVEGFRTAGLEIKKDVSEINTVNVYLDSGLNPTFDAPRDNTYGVRIVSTGTTFAAGGHLFSNTSTINSQWGWYFVDAELTKLDNCIADGHSSDGISFNGLCKDIDIGDTFIGTCGRGVNVSNNCTRLSLCGIRSVFNGLIPPWGSGSFFKYSAPFYDLAVNNSANISVDADSWFGSFRTLTATPTSLNVTGGTTVQFVTNTAVPANTSIFISQSGIVSNEGASYWVAPYRGRLYGFAAFSNLAPGAGQTYTYTLRVNDVDTALSATSTGTGSFTAYSPGSTSISVDKYTRFSLRLQTSSGATAAFHRGYIQLIPEV